MVETFRYYDPFVLPFIVGVAVMFSVVLYKYVRWFYKMPRTDKKKVVNGIFTTKTPKAVWEVISESLLHRRIFKVNPLLGYMHASLAFGWFLLIAVGWLEASMHLKGNRIPLQAHVFYKFFAEPAYGTQAAMLSNIMDLLLLFVLSGVALAWFKRMRSRALGMKKTTKHTNGDRFALTALWFIFPLRLLAESAESGLKGIPSFLTGNLGSLMVDGLGVNAVSVFATASWWLYSIALGVFFIAMPFSRYMHIFTEIPLIFLRRYGVKSKDEVTTFDHFQLEACSRCGICIDPCQLQKDVDIKDIQSVYFIRDRRYHRLGEHVVDNCLMCGRCESKCPVDIELNQLRLNSREKMCHVPAEGRYSYLKGGDRSNDGAKVGYFAGCMTMLTPKILSSMDAIFKASGEDVWWADKDGGVCCGRPLKLTGEIAAAGNMMEHNKQLFIDNNISVLVTSCPICLKVFREDYHLQGIEILHHSQYILRLIEQGKILPSVSDTVFTYHDPCELGRGSGIYDEPRQVINNLGRLVEPTETRENALCCGSSLANIEINDKQQAVIGASLERSLSETGADIIVTACPLCKKAVARKSQKVSDLAEVVASSL